MISVASLLNSDTSEPRNPQLYPRPHPHYSPVLPHYKTSSSPPGPVKPKMSKEDAGLTKATITGDVNFPPFEEDLSDEVLQEIQKYQVKPLGEIRASPKHIPYNSEKKNFWERTGRDSLEVFQYTFQLPDEKDPYTVMWDYNVGLVRITPFFKCYKYSKTTPAKMLNMNRGLKDITHSITGGSLSAQGYWMPYECARAVCATFCYTLAGALIPIFGPDFPSICTPRPELDKISWQIEPEIVREATRTAEAFRMQYSTASTNSSASASASPSQLLGNLVLSGPSCNRKRSDRPFTDSDNEVSDTSNSSLGLHGASPSMPEEILYPSNSTNHSGWTPTQTVYKLGGSSISTSSRPKRYWAEVSRNRPTRTRETAEFRRPTGLQGTSTLSDERTASPWLSALPGLASINDEDVSPVVNIADPTNSSQTPNNQFVAANANAKAHDFSRSASDSNLEARGHYSPSPTRRPKPRRSKRHSCAAQPDQNEDYDYDGELETSPGCDGDESGYSSLNSHVNTNHGGSGSDDDGEIEYPRTAKMMRRLTNEEREAAMALVQLSGNAFGSSEHEAVGRTGICAGAEGSDGMPNGQTELTRDDHGSGSGSVDAWRETEPEDTETDNENAGAKRRRIRAYKSS